MEIETTTSRFGNVDIRKGQPIIFKGLMDDQPASRWDISYLNNWLIGTPVQVIQSATPKLHWDPQTGLGPTTMPFHRFVERLGLTYSYLQDDVRNLWPLHTDYKLPFHTEKPIERVKFWMSGPGLITPLHYDPVETLHWVVRGEKRFVMYAPGLWGMKPYPWHSKASFISQLDADDYPPDRDRMEFTLREGEVLYLPAFWWHQVYSLADLNISLNFVWLNQWQKNLKHFPQFARSAWHLRKQLKRARKGQRS